MNKVTAESRERDSAVTLFGPGDYCALTGLAVAPSQNSAKMNMYRLKA